MSRPVRVIGWGNDGRSDDGAAIALVEWLREDPALAEPDVRLETYHQLGPELAADVADASLVVFADAHIADDKPDVYCERVHPTTATALDSHHCPPETLVALCESLGQSAPPCYVVGIRACDCDYGDQLTSQTNKWVKEAAQKVKNLIKQAPQQEPKAQPARITPIRAPGARPGAKP